MTLTLASAGPWASAQEGERIASAAEGRIDAVAEATIRITGFVGTVSVRPGAGPNVQFAAVREDDRKRPVVFDVDRVGRVVEFRPAEGEITERVRLEIVAPAGTAVRSDLSHSTIGIQALRSAVEIRGEDLDASVRGTGVSLVVEVRRGRVRASGVEGDVRLDLDGVDATVEAVSGAVDAELRGGTFALGAVAGDVRLTSDGTRLTVADCAGRLTARIRGAGAEFAGLQSGGTIHGEGTRIGLIGSRGVFDVTTDGDVKFGETEGELHVDSYGGALVGNGHRGLLEVVTEGATVRLTAIDGPVRVQGDALDAEIRGVTGELIAVVTGSKLKIGETSGSMDVRSEYGDVEIDDARAPVEVDVRDGNVRARGLAAPARIHAEGAELLAEWWSFGFGGPSMLVNEQGDVTVLVPADGSAKLDARSRFGRLEIELDSGSLADGARETEASGWTGEEENGPTVGVEAAGDVRIGRAAPRPPAEGQ